MMKRLFAAVLCAASLLAVVQAQEQPAAQPATPATPAVNEAKPAADPVHQQIADLRRQINALEAEVRKANPGVTAKLAEIEKQRQQTFIQAKPELEALYAQQEALMAQAKEAAGKKGGQKAKGQGGQGKPDKAERKAGKKGAGKP